MRGLCRFLGKVIGGSEISSEEADVALDVAGQQQPPVLVGEGTVDGYGRGAGEGGYLAIRTTLAVLMNWREIALLGLDRKRRESVWRAQLDFDLSPLAVMHAVRRTVPDNVLIAELHTYLHGDVGQLIQIANSESAATGHVRQAVQEFRTILFLRRGASARFEQPDGVNLDIGFPDKFSDVPLGVPTVIISPVGYDE